MMKELTVVLHSEPTRIIKLLVEQCGAAMERIQLAPMPMISMVIHKPMADLNAGRTTIPIEYGSALPKPSFSKCELCNSADVFLQHRCMYGYVEHLLIKFLEHYQPQCQFVFYRSNHLMIYNLMLSYCYQCGYEETVHI